MLASFMTDQKKTSEDTAAEVRELRRIVEQLAIQNRMLETQVAQQANSTTREHGKLPSKPEHNPRESVNAIMLQNGKHLEMISAQDTRTGAEKSVLN
ncbi:unnamed protein product [Rhodiola kirilowii]